MAESSENKKHTQKKLADDLDSMLDETEASMEQQDELIDDEDAIDRLLMDNAFDSPGEEESDGFAEIDELISESLEDSDDQPSNEIEDIVDEFADTDDVTDLNEEVEGVITEQKSDDEIQDNGEQDSINEIDEPSEGEVEQQRNSNDQPEDQDLIIDDFDISADEASEQKDSDIDQTAEKVIAEEPVLAEVNNTLVSEQNEAAFVEINTQLASLQSVQEAMKQRISDIDSKDKAAALAADELDDLQSEQRKLKHKLNSVAEKKPVFSYVALAVAIISLLVAGLGMMSFGSDSQVRELSESVVSIEEELEVLSEKENSEKDNGLTNRLDKIDSEVANFSVQLAAIKKIVEALSETEGLSKQLAQLSDQNMQMGSIVEALQSQVDALKNKKQVTKAARKKTPSSKKKWAVNLISFKQEWYAKRKAAEFEKKGIPVEVMKADIKGNTWYRLRVKGFKSKYEAAAYAAKVKKSLNLTAVWVTKN